MELNKRSAKKIINKATLFLITSSDYKDSDARENAEAFNPNSANILTDFQDISFEQINGVCSKIIAEDTIYVCDMQSRSAYKNLEYLEVSCSTEMLYITAEVNYKLSEWDTPISLKSFTNSLRDRMKAKFSVFSEQENLFDEDLFHLKFRILTTKHTNIALVIQQFAEKLEKAHRDIFARHAEHQLSLAC